MSKVDVLGQKMAYRKKPRRKTAIILALLCLLFLVDGYPFTPWLNSPYADYERVEANQDLINYVIEKDGLIFFAHPESEYDTDVVGMKMKTHPYTGLLLKNLNYTGFAVFGEGWNAAGNPGGFWDKVLMQYCSGEREQPVWAVGELDFDGELPNEFLKEVATFVWAEDNSEVAILDALKNGRCYASQFFGSKIIWLEEWNVTNLSTGETAISGQTLNTDKSVNIHFKIAVSQNYSPKFGKDEFRAYLINNGNIIQQIAFSQELNSNFTEILPEGLCYYRLWIMQGENNPIIASNPIFINRIKDEEL